MLTIENEDLLKRWLRGEIISLNNNADPIHLSDYIISIIKQNNNTSKTIEQTKTFCKGNIITTLPLLLLLLILLLHHKYCYY